MKTSDIIYVYVDNDSAGYRPGERLSGQVEWQLEKESRQMELVLLYYTESEAGKQVCEVETQTIITPGLAGRQSYRFDLPLSPYSFKGKLIALTWAIEATLSGSKAFDSKTFALSPTGAILVLP